MDGISQTMHSRPQPQKYTFWNWFQKVDFNKSIYSKSTSMFLFHKLHHSVVNYNADRNDDDENNNNNNFWHPCQVF